MNTRDDEGTVLFADICDSVRIYEIFGNTRGMEIAEQSMERMMRITAWNNGAVIRTQGDGVKCLFPAADNAYDAATKMQLSHRDSLCGIKVAFSNGTVMSSQDDVFGDTVHLAARLLGLAKAGEILLPGGTVAALSPDRQTNTRLLDTTRVKGRSEPVDVFTVVQLEDGPRTSTKTLVTTSTAASQIKPPSTLLLQHPGGEFRYEDTGQAMSIGRAETCDLVVDSHYASRLHALIELKRNYFLFTDQSTNGTYVTNQDNETVFLKRESVQLLGNGVISLGRPASYMPDDVIRFFNEDRAS